MAEPPTWRRTPQCCPIPAPARFITVDGKPVIDEMTAGATPSSWPGIGCCTASACSWSRRNRHGKFAGRVGPWLPPGWPGFEVGWGIASEFRGKGYAVEAARASIDWAFATFEIDRIVHCIDRENIASQSVARRLGAEKEREIELFGHVADVWVTSAR